MESFQDNSTLSTRASEHSEEMQFSSQSFQENTSTNLERFYEYSMKDSNVVSVESLKQQLANHLNFDWEEFNKPFNKINWDQVVNSINFDIINTEWKVPQLPQQVGKKQQKPSSINKYSMGKGTILGLGKKGNVLLLKGLKSKFTTHSYQFGDDKQKKQLSEPIENLLQQRDEIGYKDFKKLVQAQFNFELFGESRQIQSEEALEQVKYLELIKHIIGYQVKLTQDPNNNIPEKKVTGFIQTKYDDYYKEDVTKLTVGCNVISPYAQNTKDQMTVIKIENPNDVSNGDFNIQYLGEDCKTISELLNQVKMKSMDLVIQIDSCCTKKNGKELQMMPKLKVLSVILRDVQQYSQKHIGLRLLRK